MFQTEYEFTLPLGYADKEGNVHREGVMRLATAADEILPLKDPRVQSNQAYLIIILLSRVITKLGSLPQINPKIIEELFAADLSFLQEFYNRINTVINSQESDPDSNKNGNSKPVLQTQSLGEL
jgi:hypothetical protein